MTKHIPDFIQAGAFDWTRLGLSYQSDATNLEQTEIWHDIDQIVSNAKRGDFGGVSALPAMVSRDSNTNHIPTTILLLGDLGKKPELEFLAQLLRAGEKSLAVYAAQAAALAGTRWLVPAMLDAWRRADSHNSRELIAYNITDVLVAPLTFDAETEVVAHPNTYPGEVPQLLENLNLPGDTSVWGGQPFNVYRFAEQFYQLLSAEHFTPFQSPSTVIWRHKLESATGLDCSEFYINGRINLPVALSVIENFLHQHSERDYEDGVRYFYGHKLE